jgi:hypothetical protein
VRRASYRFAVQWIADTDESAEADLEAIKSLPSVLLIADLFGTDNERVARDVLRRRTKAAQAAKPAQAATAPGGVR